MSVRIAGAYLSQLRKDIEFSFVFQPANFLQVTRESLLLDLKLESLMSVLHEVLDANKKYVESFGEKGKLALPPARQFAVLTCMDARLDPAKYAGLSEGDAHVIRNAGARASDDAIRSLVISYKLLGNKISTFEQKSGGNSSEMIVRRLSGLLETIPYYERFR